MLFKCFLNFPLFNCLIIVFLFMISKSYTLNTKEIIMRFYLIYFQICEVFSELFFVKSHSYNAILYLDCCSFKKFIFGIQALNKRVIYPTFIIELVLANIYNIYNNYQNSLILPNHIHIFVEQPSIFYELLMKLLILHQLHPNLKFLIII